VSGTICICCCSLARRHTHCHCTHFEAISTALAALAATSAASMPGTPPGACGFAVAASVAALGRAAPAPALLATCSSASVQSTDESEQWGCCPAASPARQQLPLLLSCCYTAAVHRSHPGKGAGDGVAAQQLRHQERAAAYGCC